MQAIRFGVSIGQTQKLKEGGDLWKALLMIASKAIVKCFNMWLEVGVSVHLKDVEDETALHVAAKWGHADCVQVLLEQARWIALIFAALFTITLSVLINVPL